MTTPNLFWLSKDMTWAVHSVCYAFCKVAVCVVYTSEKRNSQPRLEHNFSHGVPNFLFCFQRFMQHCTVENALDLQNKMPFHNGEVLFRHTIQFFHINPSVLPFIPILNTTFHEINRFKARGFGLILQHRCQPGKDHVPTWEIWHISGSCHYPGINFLFGFFQGISEETLIDSVQLLVEGFVTSSQRKEWGQTRMNWFQWHSMNHKNLLQSKRHKRLHAHQTRSHPLLNKLVLIEGMGHTIPWIAALWNNLLLAEFF